MNKGDVKIWCAGVRARSPNAARHLAQGVLALLLTSLFIKALIEPTNFAHDLERATIVFFEDRLVDRAANSKPLQNVRVVDITSIKLAVDPKNPASEPITPRDQLKSVIDEIAKAGPAAIGIDVYFEPQVDGHLSFADEAFLDHCLDLERENQKLRIFVGIYTIARGKDHWLGEERFGPLGAAIVIPSSKDPNIPTWQLAPKVSVPVEGKLITAQTLSYQLTDAGAKAGLNQPNSEHWIAKHFSQFLGEDIRKQADGIEIQEFPIDIGQIQTLIQNKISVIAVPDRLEELHGKIVLVGRGTIGETSDMFSIPGLSSSVPGVYIHAAATETLLGSRLYTLNWWGNLAADTGMSLCALTLLFILETFPSNQNWHKGFERYGPACITLLVLVAGYGLVTSNGIFWTGFLLVAIGICMEKPLHMALDFAYKETKMRTREKGA